MKKMILIDRRFGKENSIVENIIDSIEEVEIVLLVVDSEEQKQQLKNESRIKKIVTVAEIDCWHSVRGLDYSVIRECKASQLLVENALTRYETDYNEKKFRYYCALAFWTEIFLANKVDVIFINQIMHGLPYDGILKSFSDKYSIPMFTCNRIGANKWSQFIFDEKKHCIISVFNKKQIDDLSCYLKNDNWSVLNINFDNVSSDVTYEKRGSYEALKNIIKNVVYYLTGALGVDLLSVVLGKRKRHARIASSGFYSDILYRIKCYWCACNIRRFLKKHEKEIEPGKKYIFYPLHFEPEGSIQCRLTLESQLTIIKLLADTLPEGWVLYVKEHPHQYKINTRRFEYQINNIDLFKTKKFYARLLQMENVEIISQSCTSQELVSKSQAVASILGSVLIETIAEKKPILLLSEYHPFVMEDEVLKCFSYEQCKAAMNIIKNGYKPSYCKILSVMNSYICSSAEDYTDNRIRIIKEALKDRS